MHVCSGGYDNLNALLKSKVTLYISFVQKYNIKKAKMKQTYLTRSEITEDGDRQICC